MSVTEEPDTGQPTNWDEAPVELRQQAFLIHYVDNVCFDCQRVAGAWWVEGDIWSEVIRRDLSPWQGADPVLCAQCFMFRVRDYYLREKQDFSGPAFFMRVEDRPYALEPPDDETVQSRRRPGDLPPRV